VPLDKNTMFMRVNSTCRYKEAIEMFKEHTVIVQKEKDYLLCDIFLSSSKENPNPNIFIIIIITATVIINDLSNTYLLNNFEVEVISFDIYSCHMS